ncbi:MAG: class I SAM-dependent methyltransferase [Flavobacteriales bacterium]|nr:MAG: class I SAM-dependent methyltransferase [Flavobacteriales bacterium]
MQPCSICGNADGNRVHEATERMLGFGGRFHYLECGACGCLQLLDPPSDLGRYYPKDYYSFNPGHSTGPVSAIKDAVARRAINYRMTGRGLLGRWVVGRTGAFAWMRSDAWRWNARILDIGCGNGSLLRDLHRYGFRHLTGADPFIAADIAFAPGCIIRRTDVQGITGPFDLVMLNHAFEHMPDPLATLKRIRELLAPGGHAMIRIPVAGSWAWEHYGTNWVQLDAPRHFFLHTDRSMRRLVEAADLAWVAAINDSSEFQFTGSETYLKGLRLGDGRLRFTERELRRFKQRAAVLNKEGRGDTSTYYLCRPMNG